jgi:uracil-DNA glycosylase
MAKVQPQIESSWLEALKMAFQEPSFLHLKHFLTQEKKKGKAIFPPGSEIFQAFNSTQLQNVKVVILGQDPYHGEGEAHGLSFSVKDGVAIPPSLQNIYKEIHRDLGTPIPPSGNLSRWAEQGVLLLNAILTVEKDQAASHRNQGWEPFTDAAIQAVNHLEHPVVFMLWGSFARSKAPMINRQKHLILEAPHPSPLSAYRGFIGCGHFSKANEFLLKHHNQPIQW